jgi:diguanylate cyclase (GGDEF)-like protein
MRIGRRVALAAALAGVYFVAGKLGLGLAFVHPSATAIWPPTGITLVAFLLLGYEVAPAIFLGAFLVNLSTEGSVATSFGIALGNTLEGVVGAYLVNRFAHGRQAFDRSGDILRFTLLAAFGSTIVSPTIGVTTLALGGFARWGEYWSIWPTWWLGDVGGDLIVAPLLLLWLNQPRVQWPLRRTLEAAALAAGLLVASRLVFTGPVPSETLLVTLFIWAAYRFGQREAATAIALVSGIAIWTTLHGLGPFARASPNESLLQLQAFMGAASVTSLILAAVVAEHRNAEEQLGRLAVTDPLTGLANYRRLAAVLEAEIVRSGRTGRPFAVVMFDVNGLKKINDRNGHLVGSRALTRVAEVLHMSCRAVDTAARFGGDEFTLVLPETDESAARRVIERVVERLALDRERPAITVSAGLALYPRDGDSAERVLDAADTALYEVKRKRK